MAKIYISGQQQPYEVPDDKAIELKKDWKNGNLPSVVSIGMITFRASAIKTIETIEDMRMKAQGKIFTDKELNALETELEPYKIKNPYPEYKVDKYLPTSGIMSYLKKRRILNDEEVITNAPAYDDFCKMLSAIGDRENKRQWVSEQELGQYEKMRDDLAEQLHV